MKIELNQVWTQGDDEVALFQKMSSILSNIYQVAFVGQTHKQYVEFMSQQVNQIVTREISDIWIIAYSLLQRKVRTTFLQAKYHRAILNAHNRVFEAEYFQYELLATRPQLTAVIGQRFKWPANILSFGCCNSIGSYGVFFIDTQKEIDLAYCCAKQTVLKSTPPIAYCRRTINLEIPYYNNNQLTTCKCNSCAELISCFDIDMFTNAILNLEIGTELTYYPKTLNIIGKILTPFSSEIAINSLVNFILTDFPLQDINTEFDNAAEMPTNVWVVNVDESARQTQ